MATNSEWFEKDYYKILGVDKAASDKEIQKTYRKLAKQFHPDANPGSEEKFKEISAAYEVLGDSTKRSEYDAVRAQGPFVTRTGQGAPGGFNFKVDDLGDMLGGLFNRGRRPSQAGPQRGSDLETGFTVSFADSIEGVTAAVVVVGEVTCKTCHGTGASPGSAPQQCARCQGTGSVNDNQGFFSFSQPCPACHGRGYRVDLPCSTCQGRGTQSQKRQINVRIPPGVEDGQRIRIKQKGEPGKNGGASGDLFVVVKVERDSRFGRRGNDITTVTQITFPEAVLGSTVEVPTLHSKVKLRVPEGTKAGQILRAKGYGVAPHGRRTVPGDLLVTIEIVIPKHLSDEQRKAVEDLARILPQSHQ